MSGSHSKQSPASHWHCAILRQSRMLNFELSNSERRRWSSSRLRTVLGINGTGNRIWSPMRRFLSNALTARLRVWRGIRHTLHSFYPTARDRPGRASRSGVLYAGRMRVISAEMHVSAACGFWKLDCREQISGYGKGVYGASQRSVPLPRSCRLHHPLDEHFEYEDLDRTDTRSHHLIIIASIRLSSWPDH